ncbi:MAG: cytidine deaminase [Planctomycetes bacterium]|nr:cytidine deaminase [Planctomycetota bacterium]
MEELIRRATEAREAAYAPYSGYRVGAAVRVGGRVYTGCNVENASYGLTECAERVAIFKAVSEGARVVEALAVVVDGPDVARPCGACRQVIWEFGPRARIVMGNVDGRHEESTAEELLPHSFGFDGFRPASGGD